MPTVVAVGSALLDRIYPVTNLPEPDGGAFARDERTAAGGVAANVATACARLGRDAGVEQCPEHRGAVGGCAATGVVTHVREDDGPVRGHAVAAAYEAPRPVVTGFETVELVGTDGVDGTYAVTGEGGTRYELQVGLERAEPPADATVTDIGDLFAERASFLRTALDGAATVYPETRRGEWVRHAVFGGYFRIDGATYRGFERQQTDAAFFSEEVWYVLGLSRSTATADRRLRFPEIPRDVRGTVDELLARSDPDGATLESVPETLASFLDEQSPFLEHGISFAVDVGT